MKCDSSKAVTFFSSRKTCKSSLLPSVVEDSNPSGQSCQHQHEPAGGAISCAPKGMERKENCVSKNKRSWNSPHQHVNIVCIPAYFCHNFLYVSAEHIFDPLYIFLNHYIVLLLLKMHQSMLCSSL